MTGRSELARADLEFSSLANMVAAVIFDAGAVVALLIGDWTLAVICACVAIWLVRVSHRELATANGLRKD